VIEIPEEKRIIVDTKWKIIHFRPSEDDLRQMFTYNLLFKSDRSYLVYPGEWKMIAGEYFENTQNGNCGLAFVPFIKDGKLSDRGIEIFMKNCINE
jgi:5-methylcytosine-specific restriction enzyme subunit McrC